MYVRELHVRYRKRRVGGQKLCERLESPGNAGKIFVGLLAGEAVEVCGLLCLSTTHEVLAYHELSRGTLSEAPVHPREVMRIALLANAAAVILGHNHPSGDPTPSRNDLAVTARIKQAGDVMGIELLDHIIVGFDRYLSLREHHQL